MAIETNKVVWASDPLVTLSGVSDQTLPTHTLYVVATPIGNVADISLRALWILAHVDAIAAEDTRVTRTLLNRYQIATPKQGVFAAHAHNERGAAQRIVHLLEAGARVALVTDAGTPAVSDPGAQVVEAVRAAGLGVVPVPGASSALAALSASGFTHNPFQFVGFLPTGAQQRQRLLAEAATYPGHWVLFEAPHRLIATLEALAAALDPNRLVLIARELTKLHETLTVVPASDLLTWAQPHDPRGEYVLVVQAPTQSATAHLDPQAQQWLHALRGQLPTSRLASLAAKITGMPRAHIYDYLEQLKEPH